MPIPGVPLFFGIVFGMFDRVPKQRDRLRYRKISSILVVLTSQQQIGFYLDTKLYLSEVDDFGSNEFR